MVELRGDRERGFTQQRHGAVGKVLVHGPAAGAIVETEAYLGGEDLAAHSARVFP